MTATATATAGEAPRGNDERRDNNGKCYVHGEGGSGEGNCGGGGSGDGGGDNGVGDNGGNVSDDDTTTAASAATAVAAATQRWR
jgi:hypothetical protein